MYDFDIDELEKRREELEDDLVTVNEMIELWSRDRYGDQTSDIYNKENNFRLEMEELENEKIKIQNELDTVIERIDEIEDIPEKEFDDEKYIKMETEDISTNRFKEDKTKTDFENLMKEYRNRKQKIIQIEKKKWKKIQRMDNGSKEPEKQKDKIKKNYQKKIKEHKRELSNIEDQLIASHPGERKVIKNNYGTIRFDKSRALQINNMKGAIKTIEEKGSLSKGVRIRKSYLKNLKDKGFVEDSVASFKNRVEIEPKMDNENKELYKKLHKIRNRIANEKNTEKYYIFTNKAMEEMARHKPEAEEHMKKIKGVGDNNFEKYGETFLEAIEEFNNRD